MTVKNDFDLYLKRATPPTMFDFDCRDFSSAAFGTCEVLNPEPGTWHVMVRRYKSEGSPKDFDFQVVATLLTEAGEPGLRRIQSFQPTVYGIRLDWCRSWGTGVRPTGRRRLLASSPRAPDGSRRRGLPSGISVPPRRPGSSMTLLSATSPSATASRASRATRLPVPYATTAWITTATAWLTSMTRAVPMRTTSTRKTRYSPAMTVSTTTATAALTSTP